MITIKQDPHIPIGIRKNSGPSSMSFGFLFYGGHMGKTSKLSGVMKEYIFLYLHCFTSIHIYIIYYIFFYE